MTTEKNTDLQNLQLEEQLSEKKGELERIFETRTKGAILRSKTRWHNEGEKNTKYFLNLEKRYYNQGIISQIKVKENNFVTSDKEILTECVSFYKNLYSSKIVPHNILDTSTFFRQENDTVLRDDEREACEGLLTEKECLEALKYMESEKTPGTDGLPAEFYKVFGKIFPPFLSVHLISLMNRANYQQHKKEALLSLSPRRMQTPP